MLGGLAPDLVLLESTFGLANGGCNESGQENGRDIEQNEFHCTPVDTCPTLWRDAKGRNMAKVTMGRLIESLVHWATNDILT